MTDPPNGTVSQGDDLGQFAKGEGTYMDMLPIYGNSGLSKHIVPDPSKAFFNPQAGMPSWGKNVLSALINIATGGKAELLKTAVGWAGDALNYFINKRDYNQQFAQNNAEYDRRFAQANDYNEKWADRLRAQGLHPLSAISQGVSAGGANMVHSPSMSGPLSSLSNMLGNSLTGSQIDLNQQAFEQSATRFPVELYGKELSNLLTEFEYDHAKEKAPLILNELGLRIDEIQQEISNLKADENLKVAELDIKQQELLNLCATESLIKAQQVLAWADISLTNAQIALFSQQLETEAARTMYTKAEAEELYNLVKSRLETGYYDSITKAEAERLLKEAEKVARTLWERPDDSTRWWYVGNFFWNLQNCLTLSGSASTSTGSRVVTKR